MEDAIIGATICVGAGALAGAILGGLIGGIIGAVVGGYLAFLICFDEL